MKAQALFEEDYKFILFNLIHLNIKTMNKIQWVCEECGIKHIFN